MIFLLSLSGAQAGYYFPHLSSGGSGNVTGPDPSTLDGAAIYGGDDGTTLLDSVLSGHGVLTSPGDGVEAPAPTNFGLAFSGAIMNNPGTTGWKVVPSGAVDFLEKYVQGVNITQEKGTGSPAITYENGVNLRPDTTNATTDFGGGANSFRAAYFGKFSFGGTSNGSGVSSRKFFMYDNFQSAGTVFAGPAMGFDSSNGSEWYWSSIDKTGTTLHENINFSYDNNVTTISAPANAVADSSAAVSLTLKGADKTAGTGDGGDLVLAPSTSVGGITGNVYIPLINGGPTTPHSISGEVPMWYDHSAKKLCVNDAGTVECAVMLP